MAAALVEMAAGLSTDRLGDASAVGAEAADIRRRALTLADDDDAALASPGRLPGPPPAWSN